MGVFIKRLLIFILFTIPIYAFSKCEKFDPWFTGPFLAQSATNTQQGKTNPSFTIFYIHNYATYTGSKNKYNIPTLRIIIPCCSISFGMTSWLDMTFGAGARKAKTKDGYESIHWKDTLVQLGFQILTEKNKTAIPSIRFTLTESFPTGKYQNLQPDKQYADASGSGSYETFLELNIGKTFPLYKCHPLKLILNFSCNLPSSVCINSPNVYSGFINTNGKVYPGNSFTTCFSFDYGITKRFAFSMDTLFIYFLNTKYKILKDIVTIIPPDNSANSPVIFRHTLLSINQVNAKAYILTISPALEYNFNANLGIIATYWTSLTGKYMPAFRSVAVNISYLF